MGNTHHDPTDHSRTTNPHAGEHFIDPYSWPGVVSIVLGAMAMVACVAGAAYMHTEWILAVAVVGAFAIMGGVAWLILEHRRVLRIESLWTSRNATSAQPGSTGMAPGAINGRTSAHVRLSSAADPES